MILITNHVAVPFIRIVHMKRHSLFLCERLYRQGIHTKSSFFIDTHDISTIVLPTVA